MVSNVRYIFFAFITIAMLAEGDSQLGLDLTFLQKVFLDYLVPKDPGLVSVRRMDRAMSTGSTVVLDFVSKMKLLLKQTKLIQLKIVYLLLNKLTLCIITIDA